MGTEANVGLISIDDPRDKRVWLGDDGRAYKAQLNPVTNKEHVVPVMVQNDTALLRKDEWIALDTAVMEAFQTRKRLVGDLQNRNLIHNVTNGLGTMVFQSQTRSKLNSALQGMTGMEVTDNEHFQFGLDSLPMYTIHKELQIPVRMLHASRNKGEALDTSGAAECGIKLSEKAEEILAGTTTPFTFGGGTQYGYTNYPDRVTVDLTYDWTTADGENILTDLLTMLTASQAQLAFGPFSLYVAQDIGLHLEEDFKANSDKTIRTRLLGVENIESVMTADYLPDGTVLLVQMTPNCVRLINGLAPTTVQWETNGGGLIHLRVMMILVPQLRSDFYGNCGIVHGTYTA